MTDLVDAHCHLDLYPDLSSLIVEVERQRIHTIAVTNAPSVFSRCRESVASTNLIYPAVGLHPELVESHSHELPMLLDFLSEVAFVGEIGLDYQTNDESLRERQRSVFTSILERCADTAPKVITVHSRRASADVLSIVGEQYPATVILHWFSGGLKEVDTAIERGLYFSVNPAMVRSKKGQTLIARMRRDRVLTETDGPFVTVGKRPARPVDVTPVVGHLADVWNCSADEAGDIVMANFNRIRPF